MQIFCEETYCHLLAREDCFKRIQDEISAFLLSQGVKRITLNGFFDYTFDKVTVFLSEVRDKNVSNDLYSMHVQNSEDYYYFTREELKDLFKI